jgi:hypothetical protein
MVGLWRHAPRGGKASMSNCGAALQPQATAARRTWVPAARGAARGPRRPTVGAGPGVVLPLNLMASPHAWPARTSRLAGQVRYLGGEGPHSRVAHHHSWHMLRPLRLGRVLRASQRGSAELLRAHFKANLLAVCAACRLWRSVYAYELPWGS